MTFQTFFLNNFELLFSTVALFVSAINFILSLKYQNRNHELRITNIERELKEVRETKDLVHQINGKLSVILDILNYKK